MSIRTPEQEESYELHVARDAFNGSHGHFLNHLLTAFQEADWGNFELMRPLVRMMINKYNLRCDEKCKADGTGWKGPIPEWVNQK